MTQQEVTKIANDRMDRETSAHLQGEEVAEDAALRPLEASYADFAVDPMEPVDALLRFESQHGETFKDAPSILRVAVRYWIHGATPNSRWLPDEMQTSHLLVGLEVAHQAALFVETTNLFERAKTLVWAAYRYGSDVDPKPALLAMFEGEIEARLPHTFYPPAPEMCGVELDNIEAAAERARMDKIDAKYRTDTPGMAKIFRGFNENWNAA